MKMAKIYFLKKNYILKTNPDNATDNILKCDAVSNIIILFAALKPTLCFTSAIM